MTQRARVAVLAALLLAVSGTGARAFDTGAPVQVNPQNSYASATASNATATITGQTNKRGRVVSVAAFCNVGSASLTIANGATQIWADLVTTTAMRFSWAVPLSGSLGSTVTVTLSSCGSGNVGHLSVEGDIY